jgi:hypothetical protein
VAVILTSTSDYDQVRGYLGVDDLTLPDDIIAGFMFDGVAEARITKLIAAQASNGVKSVAQILAAEQATSGTTDYIFLKAAVAAYVAYLFTHGSTNAVNTSVSDGAQTIDLGGIGAQWIEQGEKALEQVAVNLADLENWVTPSVTVFSLNGPSRANSDYDDISGFLHGAWLN